MNKTVLACTVAVALSLSFLYALWLENFLQRLGISAIGEVELAVIIAQALRVVGVVAYYRGRPPRVDVLLVLFSFETFVVTALLMLNVASPGQSYGKLAQTIFSTWVASLFTILPPYLAFAGVGAMARNRSIAAVLLPVGLEFGFLLYAASAVLGFTGSFTFSGFFNSLVSLGVPRVSAVDAAEILVPSIAVYCSLLVFSTIPPGAGKVQPRVTFVLPLLSAALSLGWVYSAFLAIPNSLLSLTTPGLLIVFFLWAYMRR